MAYQSKTYSLSDEVIAAIATGAKEYGSPNKFLKAKLVKRVRKTKGKVKS